MDKLVCIFSILVVILFLGIGIMMSPKQVSVIFRPYPDNLVIDTVMTSGSILFITGLFGIILLGFVASKKLNTRGLGAK
jgi:hypothetical protein